MKYLKPYPINESIDELMAFIKENKAEIDAIMYVLIDEHYLEEEGTYNNIDNKAITTNIREFGFYSGTMCDEALLNDCVKVARKLYDLGLLSYVGIMNNTYPSFQSEYCINTDIEKLRSKTDASMLYFYYTLR